MNLPIPQIEKKRHFIFIHIYCNLIATRSYLVFIAKVKRSLNLKLKKSDKFFDR